MADEKKGADKARSLITSFIGKIDPASIEDHKGKGDKPYVTAKLSVPGREEAVTLYAHGDRGDELKEKVEAGGNIFVQGESLARGTGLGVNLLAPKSYEGTIEKLHASGTNDYGDWASVRLAIEGMEKAKNVMLSGDDAKAAVAAGEGGKIAFNGAWKAERNAESGAWYSRLVSASSLEREPAADKDASPAI